METAKCLYNTRILSAKKKYIYFLLKGAIHNVLIGNRSFRSSNRKFLSIFWTHILPSTVQQPSSSMNMS